MNDPTAIPGKEKALQLFSLAACIMLLAWDIYKIRGLGFSISGMFFLPLVTAFFFFCASFVISWKYIKPGALLSFLISAAILADFFLRMGGKLRLVFWMGENTYLMVEVLHAVFFGLALLSSQQILRTSEDRAAGVVRILFLRFRWQRWIRNTSMLIGAIVTLFLLIFWARPRVECSLSDGKWVTNGIAAQAEYCLMKYPDAGKPCSSSSECKGSCELADRWYDDQPVPTAGFCSYYNSPFGCHHYLEYPVVHSICVD